MKKLLVSTITLIAVSSALVMTTSAYFSGTVTSSGNKFVAGTFDLNVTNQSFFNDGQVEGSEWEANDITNKLFFDFSNVNPGDSGVNKIVFNVPTLSYWACANIALTKSDENGIGEPEEDVDDTSDGNWSGELDDHISFMLWADDGDDVDSSNEPVVKYETKERIIKQGKLSTYPQGDDNIGETYIISDSTQNVWASDPASLDEDTPYFVGTAWCFGDFVIDPTTGTGLKCEVSDVTNYNNAQSDNIEGTINLYVAQAAHNDDFVCSSWEPNQESSSE